MRAGLLPVALNLLTHFHTSPLPTSLAAATTTLHSLAGPTSSAEAAAPHMPPEACLVQAAHACRLPVGASAPSSSSGDTPSSSGGMGAPRLERPKSAKRRAAEALLHRRHSSGTLSALVEQPSPACSSEVAKRQRTEQPPAKCQQQQQQQSQQQFQQQQRPPVHVAACIDCSGSVGAAAAAGCQAASSTTWCAQDVALPPMDWPAVLQSVKGEADVRCTRMDAAGLTYDLPGGVRVHVVSRAEQLPVALGALRSSMQDSCVAIDLEWKPEGWTGTGSTRVALMQLASASLAVLVRVNQLGFRMPQALRDFLCDPALTFVGFSWDGADEGKMQQTFGLGRAALFGPRRFIDLKAVGEALGYHGLGLGALTKQVLGFQPPKDRKVTMSNWEVRALSAKQVQYAALDAIITGHIFRGLRLWHASPSACTACRQMLGTVLPSPEWRCHDCERSFASRAAVMSHRQQKRHSTSPALCDECGRHVAAA